MTNFTKIRQKYMIPNTDTNKSTDIHEKEKSSLFTCLFVINGRLPLSTNCFMESEWDEKNENNFKCNMLRSNSYNGSILKSSISTDVKQYIPYSDMKKFDKKTTIIIYFKY